MITRLNPLIYTLVLLLALPLIARAAPPRQPPDPITVANAAGLVEIPLDGAAPPRSLVMTPDGAFVVSGGDDGVRVWDTGTGALVTHWADQPVQVVAATETLFAAAGLDGSVRVWTLDSGDLVWTGTHDGPVLSVAFTPAGDVLASGGADGAIRLWNAADGTVLGVLRGHESPVVALDFNANGAYLVSADAGAVRLWGLPGTLSTQTGLDTTQDVVPTPEAAGPSEFGGEFGDPSNPADFSGGDVTFPPQDGYPDDPPSASE